MRLFAVKVYRFSHSITFFLNPSKYSHIHRKDYRIQLYYQLVAGVFWCADGLKTARDIRANPVYEPYLVRMISHLLNLRLCTHSTIKIYNLECSLIINHILLSIFSLREQLRHVLKGVVHERSDISRDALKSLHSLLRTNKVWLNVSFACVIFYVLIPPR